MSLRPECRHNYSEYRFPQPVKNTIIFSSRPRPLLSPHLQPCSWNVLLYRINRKEMRRNHPRRKQEIHSNFGYEISCILINRSIGTCTCVMIILEWKVMYILCRIVLQYMSGVRDRLFVTMMKILRRKCAQDSAIRSVIQSVNGTRLCIR